VCAFYSPTWNVSLLSRAKGSVGESKTADTNRKGAETEWQPRHKPENNKGDADRYPSRNADLAEPISTSDHAAGF
jgi:hypothetical protein